LSTITTLASAGPALPSQARIGHDGHRPRNVVDCKHMERRFIAPVRVQMHMGLFDNEHSASRPQDQIQLPCGDLLEVECFPVHVPVLLQIKPATPACSMFIP
jgi:hypothetical protein